MLTAQQNEFAERLSQVQAASTGVLTQTSQAIARQQLQSDVQHELAALESRMESRMHEQFASLASAATAAAEESVTVCSHYRKVSMDVLIRCNSSCLAYLTTCPQAVHVRCA